METREMVAYLNNKGIETEVRNKKKNGIIIEGVVVKGSNNINPVIYPENFTRDSLEEFIRKFDTLSKDGGLFDAKEVVMVKNVLENTDSFKEKLRLGFSKENGEEAITRASMFPHIDEYLFISVRDYSVNVTEQLLSATGITKEEAFLIAERNTVEIAAVLNMSEVLESYGISGIDALPVWVVTTEDKFKGAAAIKAKDKIKAAMPAKCSEVYVLPSSIHETIVIPKTADLDIKSLTEMVKNVNKSEVLPEEQLGDEAFVYKIA